MSWGIGGPQGLGSLGSLAFILEVQHKCTMCQSTSDYHNGTFRAHIKGVKGSLGGTLTELGPLGASWGVGRRGSLFEVRHKCMTRQSTPNVKGWGAGLGASGWAQRESGVSGASGVFEE